VIITNYQKARVLKSITALIEQPLKNLKEAIEKRENVLKTFVDLTSDQVFLSN